MWEAWETLASPSPKQQVGSATIDGPPSPTNVDLHPLQGKPPLGVSDFVHKIGIIVPTMLSKAPNMIQYGHYLVPWPVYHPGQPCSQHNI